MNAQHLTGSAGSPPYPRGPLDLCVVMFDHAQRRVIIPMDGGLQNDLGGPGGGGMHVCNGRL